MSRSLKAYLLLGVCLVAIILITTIVIHTSSSNVKIKAIKEPGLKKVEIETSGIHNTNTLVEGDVSLDLHGSTIAALILGTVVLVATISLSSVKIIQWRRKFAAFEANSQRQQPPTAPHHPHIPLAHMTRPPASFPDPPPQPDPPRHMQHPSAPPHPDDQKTPPGDPSAMSALEMAVSRMIARDKENVYHSALQVEAAP